MKGYKVCSVIGDYYCSIIDTEGLLHYTIGEVIRRLVGNGPMAVFVSRGHAKEFYRVMLHAHMPPLKIFECEYEESKDKLLWFISTRGNKITAIGKTPGGTVFADSVKLIREAS